jgi:DNA-binding IclR family transcriptional regulator
MRTVIVPHGMGVEHLAGIECVVTGILKPHGEVVLVVTILYKNRKPAFQNLEG